MLTSNANGSLEAEQNSVPTTLERSVTVFVLVYSHRLSVWID